LLRLRAFADAETRLLGGEFVEFWDRTRQASLDACVAEPAEYGPPSERRGQTMVTKRTSGEGYRRAPAGVEGRG
jgi:hypothetical protein